MADPLDPYTVATNILSAIAAGFADAEVTLPTRQVVIAGSLPAWDTDQLTVALQRLPIGLPGTEEPARPLPVMQASVYGEFQVQLVRKAAATLANAPRRTLPSSALITTDAERFFVDMVTLSRSLMAARRQGLITASGGRPESLGRVKVGPVIAAEQQGEYLGLGALVSVLLG